jgi:hypothetical protein
MAFTNTSARQYSRGRTVDMLDRLKRLEVTPMDTEEMITLAMFARGYHSECGAQGVDVPEYVADALAILTREIRSREMDKLAKTLKDLKAAQTDDLTPSERRQLREKEIEKVQRKLGIVSGEPVQAPAVSVSSSSA